MMWRRIKGKLLVVQGVIYRVFIVFCNFLFFYFLTKDETESFKMSIGWNMINITLYYMFHYIWFKMFKLGKD
jgi:hypothetical protein